MLELIKQFLMKFINSKALEGKKKNQIKTKPKSESWRDSIANNWILQATDVSFSFFFFSYFNF
jgi:hypothetical protein